MSISSSLKIRQSVLRMHDDGFRTQFHDNDSLGDRGRSIDKVRNKWNSGRMKIGVHPEMAQPPRRIMAISSCAWHQYGIIERRVMMRLWKRQR